MISLKSPVRLVKKADLILLMGMTTIVTGSAVAQTSSDIPNHHISFDRPEAWALKRFNAATLPNTMFPVAPIELRHVGAVSVGLETDWLPALDAGQQRVFVPAGVDGIMETVLIVEDDPCVQKILRRLFESEGYRVEVYGDGQSAMDAVRKETPTAVILDLVLPVLSGKDVCREIRQESPYLPVIVVSARTDEFEKVVLLELGADDYVTKPFSTIELLARVRAAIRRAHRDQTGSSDAPHQIHFGEASVDFTRMQASVSGSPVRLTAYEFRLLNFLVQNMDRVVHRSEILTEVLGYEGCIESRTMDNVILKLRQKLERDPANPVHILTVRGLGYKFAP